jgi:hypothetical protein
MATPGQILGNGNTAGTGVVSATTEKLHLYGGTPVVQPAMTVTVGTDIATVILELAEIRAALVSLGIIDA